MLAPLIIALDFDQSHTALSLIEYLDPQTCALKVGSELFTCAGPKFVETLVQRQYKVFLDLKFHDIPNTVAKACKAAADLGVWMLNVHASGGLEMLLAAKNAVANCLNPPLLIAVTVLTSMDQFMLDNIGVNRSVEQQVLRLAKMAQQVNFDGVVCSPQEVSMLKNHCGANFLAITPGIRAQDSPIDDQSRTMTVDAALAEGSDYIVVGRPITRAENPRLALKAILEIIENRKLHGS